VKIYLVVVPNGKYIKKIVSYLFLL